MKKDEKEIIDNNDRTKCRFYKFIDDERIRIKTKDESITLFITDN